MLTLLVLVLSFTPEHGPFMFQTFWFLAVVEMAVECVAVRWLSLRGAR